jgi:hypothetical protein
MYYLIKKLRWYHRLWHRVLTFLGKECYAYEKIKIGTYQLEMDSMWLCPGCWKYKSWDCGCAHEDPEESKLCDDCWCERKEK